jgi:hypothetical protein
LYKDVLNLSLHNQNPTRSKQQKRNNFKKYDGTAGTGKKLLTSEI